MVDTSLTAYRSLGQINDDDAWGVPIAYADPASHLYDVGCTLYNCDPPVSFRIPRYAAPNTGSDGHLAVFDPAVPNAPTGYRIPVRDIRPYTGAGFLTALCGDIMQMPGLGKTPAGFNVDIDKDGKTIGLF